MTVVTVSSANKPMVWRGGSGSWVEVRVNGIVYTVATDVSGDLPASVIGVLQNAGYTVA
jgi:hypothetical protein